MPTPSSPPIPSPMERHIFDLFARITREQEGRIRALEEDSRALRQQNAGLEARLAAQEQGMQALSALLASLLATPDRPPS